jgi:hypothetical protein
MASLATALIIRRRARMTFGETEWRMQSATRPATETQSGQFADMPRTSRFSKV